MSIFPQLINVVFSPSFSCSASTLSIKIRGPIHTFLFPTSAFLGCFGTDSTSSFTFLTNTGTGETYSKAVYLGAMGSMTYKIKVKFDKSCVEGSLLAGTSLKLDKVVYEI